MSAAQVGERLCFRLSEQEYKGFLRWYKKDFLKEKDLGRVRPDFMNLKEDCCITMENEVIHIQTGNTDIWLLYSALTEVHRKEGRRNSGPYRSGSWEGIWRRRNGSDA